MAIAPETRTASVARLGTWIGRALLLVAVTLVATPDPARRCHCYTPPRHLEAQLAVPIPLAKPGLADLATPAPTGPTPTAPADLAPAALAEAFGDARPYPRGMVIAPPRDLDDAMVIGGARRAGLTLLDSMLSAIFASLVSPHA